MTTCHFCESQNVSQHSEAETYKYKGQEYDVLIDYSICDSCGEEFITTSQIQANEARVREAKKELDGLLSSEEVRCIRKELGLTQEDAALVFGGGQNAFSKYERGEVSQSAAMDKLLRLAADSKSVFVLLKEMSGILCPSASKVIHFDISFERSELAQDSYVVESSSLKSSAFKDNPSNVIPFQHNGTDLTAMENVA